MSPPRRRSARIASTQKSNKLTSGLQSVSESSESASTRFSSAKSPKPAPATPPSSAIKPPRSEMHPSKFHNNTGEPSSAVALGFTDIETSDRRKSGSGVAGTPSKSSGVPSTSFTFDLTSAVRRSSLGGDAKKIMDELREKAAKIRKELVAQRESENMTENSVGERRFAKPKSIVGRYSAAHNAEFDKMESIEGHASAWRASRFTPVVAGVKRSPSKTSLNNDSPGKTSATRSLGKAPSVEERLSQSPKKNLKRKSSAANLDSRPGAESPGKSHSAPYPNKTTERQPVKRIKQRKEDDTSTVKTQLAMTPTRPKSTLSRLMSPTKSSRLHRTVSPVKPASPAKSAIPSSLTPTQAAIVSPRKQIFSQDLTSPQPKTSPSKAQVPLTPSFARSLTSGGLVAKTDGIARRILSPVRLQKVKSILRSQPDGDSAAGSAIPQPALNGSQTPGPLVLDKELPPIPFTTPRRKLTKKVTFTPETKRAAAEQNSPSPLKSSIFRFGSASRPRSVDTKNAISRNGSHIAYPDLSAFKYLLESDGSGKKQVASVPSAFTFRSDHTIQFGQVAKTGFGSSPGQSSVRHVRESLNQSATLPGSFPALPAPSTHPDKENTAPAEASNLILPGVLHELTSKKRNRPSSDEEDAEREAAERASKKRRGIAGGAERPALSSAKAIDSTPKSNTKRKRVDRNAPVTPSRQLDKTKNAASAGGASSAKKKGMSMSRLNALARPKARV